MCVSMLFGLSFSAQAAVDVTYVSENGYVYNWGTRGTVATSLSPMAESFYASSGVAYSELKEIAGDSNQNTVSESALFEELYDIMSSKHKNLTTYDGTRTLYKYTECENSNKTQLSLFYSGETVSSTWDAGETYNREHTWPKSKSTSGKVGTRASDITMLRATNPNNNSQRGNTPYGESSGYINPYTYNFKLPNENGYDVRGDVARNILYVYVRWGADPTYHDGALDNMWGKDGVMESKEVLLSWMAADPVDTWEMGRNDSTQSITGTRNIFIDYPELAFELFETSAPSDYNTPSGGNDIEGGTTGGDSGSTPDDDDNTGSETPDTPTDTVDHYIKVTTEPEDWSGRYLIVYEDGNIAFDGSETTQSALDTAGNSVDVTINKNTGIIDASNADVALSLSKSEFIIAKTETNYTVKTASGLYIGRDANSNGLNANKSTQYTNTLSLNSDGSVNIIGKGGAYFRYNLSAKMFRYYKSSSYNSQKPIALYKFVKGAAATSYTITASSNNTSWGEVTVNGDTINAVPKSGYEVLDYTVLSGTVTGVTQNGDSFKISATSDAEIQINFVKRETSEITFYQHGGVVAGTDSEYTGDEAILPEHIGAVPQGWSFVGWVENSINETTTRPTFYSSGDEYTVDEDTALYALYCRSEEDAGGGSANDNVFELYSGDITEGDYIIVYDNSAMNTSYNNNVRLNYTDVIINDNTITTDDETIIWHIAPVDDNLWTLYNEAAASYAAGTGTKNQATLIGEITDFAKWKATGTYEFVNLGNENKGVNKTLRRNGSFGFACYATTTGGALSLYKRSESGISTIYYYFTDGETASDTETDGYYIKVTEEPTDWTGDYLIVATDKSEENVVFDGSRKGDSLDVGNNVITNVVVNGDIIKASAVLKAAQFTVAASDESYSIKSASGYYIGNSKDENDLETNASTSFANTFSLNDDNTVNIIGSGGAYLRFNSNSGIDNYRFRYYKSTSYTNQTPITLYKYVPFNSEIVAAQIEISADLSVNYYVSLENEELIDVNDMSMRYTIDEDVFTTDIFTKMDENYVFVFNGIAPQRMTDNIKAELLLNGDVLEVLENYSVQTNAKNLLEKYPENATLKTFIADMLYYGAAAQTYANYKTDTLATDGLDLSFSEATPEELYANISESTGSSSFRSATVWFDSTNSLIVKVRERTENTKVTVTVNGNTVPLEYNDTIDGYKTPDILATDFGTTYTFKLYEGDTAVQTLVYSVNTYAYSKYTTGKTQSMKDLALALYRYGVSAKAYYDSIS